MLIEDLDRALGQFGIRLQKYFLFPVDGRISSLFGWRVDPVEFIGASRGDRYRRGAWRGREGGGFRDSL